MKRPCPCCSSPRLSVTFSHRFKVAENVDEQLEQEKHHCMNSYGEMTKTMQRAGSESKFVLRLQKGSFNDSEIVVLLGENGTGRTPDNAARTPNHKTIIP